MSGALRIGSRELTGLNLDPENLPATSNQPRTTRTSTSMPGSLLDSPASAGPLNLLSKVTPATTPDPQTHAAVLEEKLADAVEDQKLLEQALKRAEASERASDSKIAHLEQMIKDLQVTATAATNAPTAPLSPNNDCPTNPVTSRTQLTTCYGERLPPGVGYNKSYTDAPIFNGSDREGYKDWKRAALRKLKMSACLYPTPDTGVLYLASRLSDVAADILNDAIDNGEADDVTSALNLLDTSFEDSDEYGTALAAMDKLKMTPEDTVDGFLAKWNKLNIMLGRNKNSRPAVTEFRNKLPAAISAKLMFVRPTAPLHELVEQARWVEQNLAQFRHAHPRDATKPLSTTRATTPRTSFPANSASDARASATPNPSSTSTTPRLPLLTDALKRQAVEHNLCFRCRKPGHRAANCTAFADRASTVKPATAAVTQPAEIDPEAFDRAVTPAPSPEN